MTKKELVAKAIEKLGYKPQTDEDGYLFVRYQMKYLYVIARDEEENYVSVIYPQFAEIAEGEDTLFLAVCNKLTRDVKFVKVYVDQTFKNVSASCEFFYTDEESLQECMERSLHVLGVIRSVFRQAKKELCG